MERIGNIGWFLTDEEYERISNAVIVIKEIIDSVKPKNGHPDNITDPDLSGGVPYEPNHGGNELNIPDPCPNCPWKGNGLNPWVNPADWTWRPWQAPWYGPGDPINPNDWKIGDGEWWKHQPYCTSTTADDPNAVKQTKTTGECHCQEK